MTNTTFTHICPTCGDTIEEDIRSEQRAVCCGWEPEILDICDHLFDGFRGHIRGQENGRKLVNLWVNDPTQPFAGVVVLGLDANNDLRAIDLKTTANTKMQWSALYDTGQDVDRVPFAVRVAAERCEADFEENRAMEGLSIAVAQLVSDWERTLEGLGNTPHPPSPSPSPIPSAAEVERLREIAEDPNASNQDYWAWRSAVEERNNGGVEPAPAPAVEDDGPSCGWDGLTVTFGEGCDDDTLNMVFGRYNVEVTLRNGLKLQGVPTFGWNDGWNANTVEVTPEMVGGEKADPDDLGGIVSFNDVAAIHIY